MIVWLALIPAVFLAMLAMERLEERLVPSEAAHRPEPEPRRHDRPGSPAAVAELPGPAGRQLISARATGPVSPS